MSQCNDSVMPLKVSDNTVSVGLDLWLEKLHFRVLLIKHADLCLIIDAQGYNSVG